MENPALRQSHMTLLNNDFSSTLTVAEMHPSGKQIQVIFPLHAASGTIARYVFISHLNHKHMNNLFINCVAHTQSITLQVSERFTPEEEVVLTVLNYTNHPLFNITEGPIGGHDIGIYFVDDEILRKPGVIRKGKLYPACLPSKAHKSNRGIFAGIH